MELNQLKQGYVDIHCHILPNCDDGAADLEDSLEMAKMAYQNGTRYIIATPHTMTGVYQNDRSDVLENCKKLNKALADAGIDLKVLPGNEIHVHVDFVETYLAKQTLSLADTGKYVLLEFAFHSIPSFVNDLIYELQLKGITPIIPHPERYVPIIDSPEIVYDWIKEGALTQITAGSLTGRFGENAKKCAETLIKHNLAHMIASDGHNISNRKPTLQKGYDALVQWIGREGVAAFDLATKQVLLGEAIDIPEPEMIRKRKFWFFK